MQKITNSQELKNAIELLEVEQSVDGQLLKDQFLDILDSFKPVNLIENTLKDIISSPYLMNNALDTSISMATGYLSKKIVVGASDNIFRKLFGAFLQHGVTGFIARNPEAIKAIGQFIFQRIFPKKEMNSTNCDRQSS